uniref:Uncharacterized protein n=1 Tax=Arundo donax TaxID=35708 RepID=A0A0A9Q051_ARUDO
MQYWLHVYEIRISLLCEHKIVGIHANFHHNVRI